MLKNVVESLRRWRAGVKRRRAFRVLLAHECELNLYAHKFLTDALTAIQGDFTRDDPGVYSIERTAPGEIVLQQWHGDRKRTWLLPAADTDLMGRVMRDATLDPSLIVLLQAAHDSAINVRHVRESLIHFVESDDADEKLLFRSFPEYALRELPDFSADLEKLYQKCTGMNLSVDRVPKVRRSKGP
jgi:hypothetical protein